MLPEVPGRIRSQTCCVQAVLAHGDPGEGAGDCDDHQAGGEEQEEGPSVLAGCRSRRRNGTGAGPGREYKGRVCLHFSPGNFHRQVKFQILFWIEIAFEE